MKYFSNTCSWVILIMATVVFSETPSNIQKGIKIGVNWSTWEGSFEYDFKTGATIGGFGTILFNDFLAMQCEVLYSMKGAIHKINQTGNSKSIMKLDYLEIPVLAKLILPTSHKFKPNLIVGPAYSFKLKGTYKDEIDEEEIRRDFLIYHSTEEKEMEDLKSYDLSFMLGLGAEFQVSNKIFSISVRYDSGLIDILEIDDLELENKTLSITTGLSF